MLKASIVNSLPAAMRGSGAFRAGGHYFQSNVPAAFGPFVVLHGQGPTSEASPTNTTSPHLSPGNEQRRITGFALGSRHAQPPRT
jgi:hypothetical protein